MKAAPRRLHLPALVQGLLVIGGAWLLFAHAFPPVMPRTLMVQFMVITVVGVLLYFSYDDDRWREFKAPLLALLREPKLWAPRWLLLLAVPGVVAWTTYGLVRPTVEAPVELRQVHPAPPSTLRVFGKSYDLATLENPKRAAILEQLRSDPEGARAQYDQTVAAGREVYYQNCFYCHGDRLDGAGHFAQGFNPLPANFQDVGTIAQLQEAFLFWRITTGGPGLPKEGTPWNSAMPVWHEFLDEGQVWDVITFLYDYVGQVPRMWDQETSRAVTGLKELVGRERAGQTGKALYRQRCAVCHGDEGLGDGPAAEFLYPKPRDFSLALFKYKTTPPQQLPSDDDLLRTLRDGLPGTGMPGWKGLLSDTQLRSLIPVIKGFDITFSWPPEEAADDAFDDQGRYTKDDFRVITESEPLAGQVPYSTESVARGREAFLKTCNECHGEQGRGNVTSGKKLADDWGQRIWPRNLTKPWTWRATGPGVKTTARDDQNRDATIQAIYRRLSIGIPGTPMPAHRAVEEGNQDPISLEDRWHIANYVYSLREGSVPPGDRDVLTATRLADALPEAIGDPRWDAVPATTLHLVPNLIKGERLFTPLNDALTVRTVYDDTRIVFLLEFDDRTDSRPGEPYSIEIQDETLELHPDAVAIQFPLQEAFTTKPVVVKPLYRHGDAAHPTSIWYWNAGSVEPPQPPRTVLFDATGPDAALVPRPDTGGVVACGTWHEGRWRVLMSRPRTPLADGDIRFDDGRFIPVSFANWDGSNGEAGSRHTLTTWAWLLLPPQADPLRTYGLPAGSGLLTLLLGLWLVRRQRRGRVPPRPA